MRNDPCFPCMERPPRCFITSVTHDRRLTCNKKGIVSTTDNRTTSEEFYIIEGSDGTTIFQSVLPHGRILISTPDGDIATAVPPSFSSPPSSSSPSSSDQHPTNTNTSTSSTTHTDYHRWYVHKDSRSGEYSISSVETARYLAYQHHPTQTAYTSDEREHKNNDRNRWKLELRTGELCFVSNYSDVRLTCGPNGNIGLSENWKGWEVWRFTEAGDGDVWISSWTHGKALCEDATMVSHGSRRVSVGSTEEREGAKARWRVERAPNGYNGVVIRSRSTGRYLMSDHNHHGEQKKGGGSGTGGVSTSRLFDGAKTTWQLSAAHGQRYYVSSVPYNRRIGCRSSSRNKHNLVVYTTTNRNDTETWELQKLDNGLVVFKSTVRDAYLSCFEDDTTTLRTLTLRAGELFTDKAMWKLQHTTSSNKGLRIVSKLHDLALSCDKDGTLSLTSNTTTTTTTNHSSNNNNYNPSELLWTLEPSLPQSVNKNQMLRLATGGAIAVASVALMPLAVVGVVGALGFTSTGVAAGSIAAGMMSAEAAAAGGAIAAGGTVATLQSIGVVGLGVAGTSAAMGGGAIVGASALGVSVAASGVGKKVFEGGGGVLETLEVRENRPFCDWSSW